MAVMAAASSASEKRAVNIANTDKETYDGYAPDISKDSDASTSEHTGATATDLCYSRGAGGRGETET